MVIIAALISACVALTVPFITFYLNRSTSNPSPSTYEQSNSDASASNLIIAIPIAAILSVPIGFLAFTTAVILNTITVPEKVSVLLFSLDAGLSSSAVFAVSVVVHVGLSKARHSWAIWRWYPILVIIFSGSLGYLLALVGNSIWALALQIRAAALEVEPTALRGAFDKLYLLWDAFDAAVLSAASGWFAAFGAHKLSELRQSSAGADSPNTKSSRLSANCSAKASPPIS